MVRNILLLLFSVCCLISSIHGKSLHSNNGLPSCKDFWVQVPPQSFLILENTCLQKCQYSDPQSVCLDECLQAGFINTNVGQEFVNYINDINNSVQWKLEVANKYMSKCSQFFNAATLIQAFNCFRDIADGLCSISSVF